MHLWFLQLGGWGEVAGGEGGREKEEANGGLGKGSTITYSAYA